MVKEEERLFTQDKSHYILFIFGITKIKHNNVDSILDCSWEILEIMFGVKMA